MALVTVKLTVLYVMMPLAFCDPTRKGLSCLLKVAAIMLCQES
jgi:hypothetical protein